MVQEVYLAHLSAVAVAVVEDGHGLVAEEEHHGVEEADAVHALDVVRGPLGGQQRGPVLWQREGKEQILGQSPLWHFLRLVLRLTLCRPGVDVVDGRRGGQQHHRAEESAATRNQVSDG